MCTPQSLQALRWMTADLSTMVSLLELEVTESLSRGTTPTTLKREPEGFQHLEQPPVIIL